MITTPPGHAQRSASRNRWGGVGLGAGLGPGSICPLCLLPTEKILGENFLWVPRGTLAFQFHWVQNSLHGKPYSPEGGNLEMPKPMKTVKVYGLLSTSPFEAVLWE